MPLPAASGSLTDADCDCASKGPTPTKITANVNTMPYFMFSSKASPHVHEIELLDVTTVNRETLP